MLYGFTGTPKNSSVSLPAHTRHVNQTSLVFKTSGAHGSAMPEEGRGCEMVEGFGPQDQPSPVGGPNTGSL